jgi:O-antigen chain-terminating methyltransferase
MLRGDPGAGLMSSARVEDSGKTGTLPSSFEFALQSHFRGSEQKTAMKLQTWLDAIGGIPDAKRLRDGRWLDIGCGRGEWLRIITTAGIRATGIDASPAAIDHCRASNLTAETGDALTWLRHCPDASLAVITAFHVAEHLHTEALLSLVQLAARKLQLGGVLAIETPNPANLQMGAHHFWNDPTHQRPVPVALLRFMFEYFGLSVVKHLELNPCPAEEHLPFTEIEIVRQIDRHLYGPQDYGLLGRRES